MGLHSAALRAEKIFALEFGGQPWVGREAPISSIDPAVTQAVLDTNGAGHGKDEC